MKKALWIPPALLLGISLFCVACAEVAGSAEGVDDARTEKASEATVATEGDEREMERATFAAGCFWGVESAFRQVPGVKDVTVGYTGGRTTDPTYRQVCSGETGHAEAVEIVYDPTEVTFDTLLDVFWRIHDPTQINRQGPDVGEQYRSAVFYHTPEQKQKAEASKKALNRSGMLRRPIATKIEEARPFYRAEEYHQRYLEKNGLAACHVPGL